jgi:hypothetical protein
VNNAPCADARGNGGKCPKDVREKIIDHEEDCDDCNG